MKRFFVFGLLFIACSNDDSTGTPTTDAGADGGPTTADGGDPFPDGNTGEVTPPRRVFVSEALRTGANGGTAGADAVCAQEAKSANLVGEFFAWLSTPTSKAADKLGKDRGFIRPDGKPLWNSREDIAGGVGPDNPITLNARGKEVTGPTFVWTGADANGAPTATNCNEWTTNAVGAVGGAGVFGGIGKEWTQAAAPKDCGESAPLLCFEK